jgi:hypothetical protein
LAGLFLWARQLDGLLWLLLLLVPLFVVQRRLHFETQAVLLLLTRRGDISTALFAVLFFPGVLLHETSHFIMARFLRVRTVNFSLIPKPQPDGKLQLGYVETDRTDLLRDALIGAAPLIAGGVFVAYAGLHMLGLGTLWEPFRSLDLTMLADRTIALSNQPDFWLWLYLAIAVSSTMLPSASDRRAWMPISIVLILLTALAIVAGAGPWLEENGLRFITRALRAVAIVFGLSLVLQFIILVPTWGLRKVISRLTNLRVV